VHVCVACVRDLRMYVCVCVYNEMEIALCFLSLSLSLCLSLSLHRVQAHHANHRPNPRLSAADQRALLRHDPALVRGRVRACQCLRALLRDDSAPARWEDRRQPRGQGLEFVGLEIAPRWGEGGQGRGLSPPPMLVL